jgi:trehalose 6-phosphate phosphatase
MQPAGSRLSSRPKTERQRREACSFWKGTRPGSKSLFPHHSFKPGLVVLDVLKPFDFRRYALLLDIDGTILDFAPTPREVWVPIGFQEVLVQLLRDLDGALALVSGRSFEDIDLIFSPLQFAGVGCHGAELRPTLGAPKEHSHTVPLDEDVKRRFAPIRKIAKGILLEDKDFSLAIHYRLAPKAEKAIYAAVTEICASLPAVPIEVLRGKFVVEIKSAGVTKASGVRSLMQGAPFIGRAPIFLGDDVTDETVFPIIPEFSGYCFSVGRKIEGTDGCFDNPAAVRKWLTKIAQSGTDVAAETPKKKARAGT